MEDTQEDMIRTTFRELEMCTKATNEQLRVFLNGLSREGMIVKIMRLNLSDKSLNFLCQGIALEHEDYEICIAVEKIKKERAQNKRRSA